MAFYRCGAKPEEEKTVTAGTSAIEVLPSSGKVMKKVTVNPTPSETKTVTPKASKQTVSPSSGKLLSKVTVNGDADLVAGNIKSGVNIFGVGGTFDNSEGLYAWKKSSVDCIDNITTQTRKNYTLGNATSDTTVYYSTSYTFDETTGTYTLVNPKSATLQYVQWGVYSVEMVKSNYYIWGSTSSNEIYNTNASSTYNVYLKNADGSVFLESDSADYKYDIHSAKTEYTFLDYVVSDKKTAYPDCTVHTDGYYYEKVPESWGSKIETMTVTKASGYTYSTIDVSNPFGNADKVKSVIALCNNSAYDIVDIIHLKDIGDYYKHGSNDISMSSSELVSITDSTITLKKSTSYSLSAGTWTIYAVGDE